MPTTAKSNPTLRPDAFHSPLDGERAGGLSWVVVTTTKILPRWEKVAPDFAAGRQFTRASSTCASFVVDFSTGGLRGSDFRSLPLPLNPSRTEPRKIQFPISPLKPLPDRAPENPVSYQQNPVSYQLSAKSSFLSATTTLRTTLNAGLLAAGLVLSTSIPLLGQATSADPNSGSSPAAGKVVELEPFQVNSDKDVGYIASSSLAGSRLNSQLRDTAASISVMTAEFLADIGATDLEEAMLYANNVQQNVSDEVAGVSGGNSAVEFFTNYRIRGIRANTARNFYTWSLPTDLYNVDRVDQARGPNSILFGIGSAGGIINTSTKSARLDRDAYEAGLVFSSHDSKRGTIDLNKVLIPDTLGVRLNAVYDDSETFRLFEGSEKRLFDIAVTWKPYTHTAVRGHFETGTIDQVRTRPWGLVDVFSTWEAAGSPVTATLAANAGLGIGRLAAGTARVTYIEQADALYDLRGSLFSSVPATRSNRMDVGAQFRQP